MSMFTTAFAMWLKPGCLEGYRRAHEALWPEIARSMSENGVSMAIYQSGEELCVFAVAPSEEAWNRSRSEPALARWDAAMTEFLESSEPGKIAFRQLERVFGFGEFK